MRVPVLKEEEWTGLELGRQQPERLREVVPVPEPVLAGLERRALAWLRAQAVEVKRLALRPQGLPPRASLVRISVEA